jgi:23S rRNA pseudouridine2605 synthase
LDYETEGLLIFTNDGDFTNRLTHPSFEHEKEYEVYLDKKLTAKDKEDLEHGIKIDNYLTLPAIIKLNDGRLVRIIIHEGKKRQIRRMFSALGYTVLKLVRVRVGKLELHNLKAGEIKEIKKSDII